MKKIILNSIVFTTIFCLGLSVTYFAIKARNSSSSWMPMDTSNPATLYVSNNEILTAAKRNALVDKVANKSAFSANWSTTSVWHNAFAKIAFTSEYFDTNNEFDLSTSVFTPKRAGKYLFTAYCRINTMNDWSSTITSVYKNWIKISDWSRSPIWATYGSASLNTTIVDANGSTDYFEIYCRQNGWWTKSINQARVSGVMVE